jgi:hypothetical protein
MALHTVVYTGTDIGEDHTLLSGVPDTVFGTLNGALIPPTPMRIVALVAGGGGMTGALVRQRSMDITPANIHPVNILPWPSPVGYLCQPTNGPRAPGGEAIEALAQSDSSPNQVAVVGWFADRIEPVPDGDQFLLKFSASVTSIAKRWVATAPISLDLVSSLPVGRYHVVGMEAHADSGDVVIAARLLLPNQVHRPGVIVHTTTTSEAAQKLPPEFQLDGRLGCWGWFEQGSLPRLEVLEMAGGKSVSLRGHLRIVRVGTEGVGGMGAVIGGAVWG